ncbi:MAG: mechanosensitive ion channel [Methanomassiliicoccales archaeon]|nr:mechanosensitive ion channel [Methanomassiliicoccales archaeon]
METRKRERRSKLVRNFNKTILMAIFGIAIISLVPCAFSLASASQPINIFSMDSHDQQINAGEIASYRWVLFNNASSAYLIHVSVNPLSDKDWHATFNKDFITLSPDQDETIILNITTSRTMGTKDLSFVVVFNVTEMSEPTNTYQITQNIHLKIVSLFGTRAGENKLFGIWDNFLPSPFDTNYGAFIFTLIGWIVIALVIAFIIDPIVHRFTRKTKTELDDRLLKIIHGPLFAIIVLYGIVNSLEILNIPIDIIATIELIYSISMVIIIVWLAYRIYDNILIYYAKSFAKKTEMEIDDVLVPLFEKIGMIIIPLLGFTAILHILGFDVTVIIAGVGVLGLVIGLAAQSTLSNLFAGLQLLVDRPFKVGDLILMEDGEVCEVRKIGLRSITLYDIFKHSNIIIPNNEIANKKIINIVQPDRKYKRSVTVGVAYGSDVKKVESILLQAALEHPNVLKDEEHAPVVRFEDFGDSALIFTIYFWVDDVRNQWKATSDIRKKIDEKFREAGIEIPFPQRTVWLRQLEKDTQTK